MLCKTKPCLGQRSIVSKLLVYVSGFFRILNGFVKTPSFFINAPVMSGSLVADWPQFTQAQPPPRTPEAQAAWEAGLKAREAARLRERYGGESTGERRIVLED